MILRRKIGDTSPTDVYKKASTREGLAQGVLELKKNSLSSGAPKKNLALK